MLRHVSYDSERLKLLLSSLIGNISIAISITIVTTISASVSIAIAITTTGSIPASVPGVAEYVNEYTRREIRRQYQTQAVNLRKFLQNSDFSKIFAKYELYVNKVKPSPSPSPSPSQPSTQGTVTISCALNLWQLEEEFKKPDSKVSGDQMKVLKLKVLQEYCTVVEPFIFTAYKLAVTMKCNYLLAVGCIYKIIQGKAMGKTINTA